MIICTESHMHFLTLRIFHSIRSGKAVNQSGTQQDFSKSLAPTQLKIQAHILSVWSLACACQIDNTILDFIVKVLEQRKRFLKTTIMVGGWIHKTAGWIQQQTSLFSTFLHRWQMTRTTRPTTPGARTILLFYRDIIFIQQCQD